MAERRMLAKSIMETDTFSCMPIESQMLYVRLIIAADDDGFVANPRSIMRMYGFGDDSMKLLIAKKYVLAFEKNDGFVYLIKHWRIHNYIRSDRYKASTFKELLRGVYYDENNAYSTNPEGAKRPCLPIGEPDVIPCAASASTVGIPSDIPTVYQPGDNRETQDRLGKDRGRLEVVEVSTGEENNNSISLSESEKSEKIAYYRRSLQTFRNCGFETQGVYAAAAAEGITKEDIDKEDINSELSS